MIAEADIAAVGALIGDRARASMLNALMGGEPISAGELARIGGVSPSGGLRATREASALKRARTCYDHLAGELGVAATDMLVERTILARGDGGFSVTRTGRPWLEELGLDLTALARARRSFARGCVDWTERRPHVAGSLGAGIAAIFFARGWVRRRPGGRAVVVTSAGAEWLERSLGLTGYR
ncbi:MAG TPA: hypothetical protein VLB81_01180 [Gaiellales bacterium]|nr:hypothetical protein [Gaiellales bacterium]